MRIFKQCCSDPAFTRVAFETFDVLSDMEIRQGIKEFSSWPTIPQIYVQGEFMGGSDILIEMFNSGELKEKLEVALAS
jgi:monothiol glutaredoxin